MDHFLCLNCQVNTPMLVFSFERNLKILIKSNVFKSKLAKTHLDVAFVKDQCVGIPSQSSLVPLVIRKLRDVRYFNSFSSEISAAISIGECRRSILT